MIRSYDPRPLSERQQAFVDAVDRLTRTNGYAPTIREVADVLGVCVTRAHDLAWACERHGTVAREPRIPRSLRVVPPAADATDPAAGTSKREHGR